MQRDEDIPADVRSTMQAMSGKKKEGYGFAGRLIFFVVFTAVIIAVSAAIFVPFAIGASMSAGGASASSPLALIPAAAVIAISLAGFFIFKK